MTKRRFLLPDDTSRIDAVGWSVNEKGDVSIRIHDSEHEVFWSFSKADRHEAQVLLANLIEPLQAVAKIIQGGNGT